MAEYSVIEDRTYTCLKDDKSVSLNDLTPQNIDNTAYWKYLQYNVGEFVMVPQDSTISSDPLYQRPSELEDDEPDPDFSPLYIKGIYKCTTIDYDIKISKVKTFSTWPTKLDAKASAPLCFGKYVDATLTDGTLQRVNIALQKWTRVADLPTS